MTLNDQLAFMYAISLMFSLGLLFEHTLKTWIS